VDEVLRENQVTARRRQKKVGECGKSTARQQAAAPNFAGEKKLRQRQRDCKRQVDEDDGIGRWKSNGREMDGKTMEFHGGE
jgi:hypothetical protein